MKDRMVWFCTVGYKHKIRVFINSREDKFLLKLRYRDRKTIDEMVIKCPKELDIFVSEFQEHLKTEELIKLNEIKDKLDKYCHDECKNECLYKTSVKFNDDEDNDYDMESQLSFFISYGLT
jgi:hypothetical protein